MHARCTHVSFTRQPALAGSTVRGSRCCACRPVTFFALEDNQSSASARTHPFGRAGAGFKVIIHDSDQCNTDPFEEVRYYTSSGQGLRIRAPDKLR